MQVIETAQVRKVYHMGFFMKAEIQPTVDAKPLSELGIAQLISNVCGE